MNAEASFCRSGDAAATAEEVNEERGGQTEQDSSQLVSRGEMVGRGMCDSGEEAVCSLSCVQPLLMTPRSASWKESLTAFL